MSNNLQDALEAAERQEELAIAALDYATWAEDAALKLKIIEAAIREAINNQIGADGKPEFSNEVKHDTEFIRRTTESQDYQSSLADMRTNRYEAKESTIHADHWQNIVQIRCAFAEAK